MLSGRLSVVNDVPYVKIVVKILALHADDNFSSKDPSRMKYHPTTYLP